MSAIKAELIEQKTQLIAYLASKIKAGDFHAVQDAASDIREIDAKLDMVSQAEQVKHGSDVGYCIRHDVPFACSFCASETARDKRYDPLTDTYIVMDRDAKKDTCQKS